MIDARENEYLLAAQVARLLHVSPKTVSRWAKEGKLPYSPVVMSWLSSQLGKRSKLITQAEVDRLSAS